MSSEAGRCIPGAYLGLHRCLTYNEAPSPSPLPKGEGEHKSFFPNHALYSGDSGIMLADLDGGAVRIGDCWVCTRILRKNAIRKTRRIDDVVMALLWGQTCAIQATWERGGLAS